MENKNTLNYIDKLWDVLKSLQKSINRSFILLMVFTLIFFFLSAGLVSIDGSYVLLGIHVTAKPWITFVMGILLQNVLFVYLIIVEDRSHLLKREILDNYKKIGVEIKESSFLHQTNMRHVLYLIDLVEDVKKMRLWEQILMLILMIGILVTIFLFPLITIILLTVKLLIIFHTMWLFWLPIIAVSLFPALSYTALILKMFKRSS